VRSVIVTAKATTPGSDFVSRFFAPGNRIAEEPATGSSHCVLALYKNAQVSKQEMRAHQASPREGILGVRLAGPRVRLRDYAVVIHNEKSSPDEVRHRR
jgi:predicted PhzF superfamily epimerase YddE/YHI9